MTPQEGKAADAGWKGAITKDCFGRLALLALLSGFASVALASTAHAGAPSALASDNAASTECAQTIVNGGSGFAEADLPSTSCTYLTPLNATEESVVSASGSWITGQFSVYAKANTNPATGTVPSITVVGSDVFTDYGTITLPSGMTSATVTFGVTGLSGTVSNLTAGAGDFASVSDMIELDLSAGVSSEKSVACLNLNAFASSCPGSGLGEGLGPGSLAPLTATVTNGETLTLGVRVTVTATSTNYDEANGSITVDPVYLTLPPGVTFDSGVSNFLSGAPPVLEESTWAMLLIGFAALGLAGHWRMGASRRVPAPSGAGL